MKEPLRKILVTTDGSPASEAVFPAIMPLVRTFDPEVLLLYVFEDPNAAFEPPPTVQNARRALQMAHVKVFLKSREGKAAEEILREARESQADLLAISTQGRGGIARLVGGSVAEEVLRRAELPLLITRPGISVHEWKTLTVALDGSKEAEEILPEVVRLARTLGAKVELVQSAFTLIAPVFGDHPILLPSEDPMPYLMGVVDRLKAQGVEASAVALEGNPGPQLLRHLEGSNSPLLCMTTHGRGGLSRLLLGSIAELLVRKAPCPVLLRRIRVPEAAPDATVQRASRSSEGEPSCSFASG